MVGYGPDSGHRNREVNGAYAAIRRVPSAPSFIDLFCGCGGFTLGMLRSGFRCVAAVDFDPEAIGTLNTNLVGRLHDSLPPVEHALCWDLTRHKPGELADLLGMTHVDVVVGGPPCQGFSTARQADGANHGERLKSDPRRRLFRYFLRYVDFFQPLMFVMENVLGLRSAAGGRYFTAVQKLARELGRKNGKPGYRVHGQVEDAWESGVPQKRRRQFIIGVRSDIPGYFLPDFTHAPRAMPHTMLGAVIGDLPPLHAGEGQDTCPYDHVRRAEHLRKYGRKAKNYLSNVLEIHQAESLTGHKARPHSARDLRDFARLREGENSATAIRERGVKFEFPYDKSTFKDRYTRQSRSRPCSTIVAHLSKDGLMFIHPTQNRSLTPREAARIQSFPDWFRFPSAQTHAYRLIGNAVPPLVAEAVGFAIARFLGSARSGLQSARYRSDASPCATRRLGVGRPTSSHGETDFPRTRIDAARQLELLASLDRRALRLLPAGDFLRGWHALLFLFPHLHPDNALDHGHSVENVPITQRVLPGFEDILSRRYARSGWPVALELIGCEAWRRYDAHEFSRDQFYCVEAQCAGLETAASHAPEPPGRV